MNILVGLFRMYSLATNVAKSRTITCHTRALRVIVSEEAMALKCTWVKDPYQVRLLRRIPCLECGVELSAGSVTSHRRRICGTDPTINWIRLLVIQTVHQT